MGVRPLRIMQLLPLATAIKGKRGVTGTEIIPAISLPFWDLEAIELTICYSSKGRLNPQFQSYRDKINLIDFYVSNKKRIFTLCKLLRLLGKHRIEVLHTHGPIYTDFVATIAARLVGIPNVVSRHVMIRDLSMSDRKKRMILMMDRFTKRLATIFTSICYTGMESLIAEGCSRSKITNINNGIDQSRFLNGICLVPNIYPDGDWSLKSIMVAQMVPQKRFDVFIRALAKGINEGRLWSGILVGDGPNKEILEILVKELGIINNIRFLGFREDLPELLNSSDVIVLVSHAEGLPMVLIEAMSCGLPVVANDIGGVRELIQNGKSGFLLNDPDSDELYQALVRLENSEFRNAAGQASYNFAHSRFSVKEMVKGYTGVYLETYRKWKKRHLNWE